MTEPMAACGIDIGCAATKAVIVRRRSSSRLEFTRVYLTANRNDPGEDGADAPCSSIIARLGMFAQSVDGRTLDAVIGYPDTRCFCRQATIPDQTRRNRHGALRESLLATVPLPPASAAWARRQITEIDGDTERVIAWIAPQDEISATRSLLKNLDIGTPDVVARSHALSALLRFLQSRNLDFELAADVGVRSSLLVVSNAHQFWCRSIPVGGEHFTQVIQQQLSIGFGEAERQKRNAAHGGDARALFAAMRPVFECLVDEFHRSFAAMAGDRVAIPRGGLLLSGGGARLAGLPKYLEQRLQCETVVLTETLLPKSASLFRGQSERFAVAAGLALTALLPEFSGATFEPADSQPGPLLSRLFGRGHRHQTRHPAR
jgi:type IV pilus assembly protein PilM